MLDTLSLLLTLVSCRSVAMATSDFYYDHWKCNNYLSGETVVVPAGPSRLLELHIRDNIGVSI